MAFAGIFMLIIVVAIVGLLLIAFAGFMIFSAVATLASGVCWGVMKKNDIKRRDIPLVLFISFGILLAGMVGIVLVCHFAFVSLGSSYDNIYTNQYSDLGIYAEETADEIAETECITLNGTKYYMPDYDSTIYYRSRELTPEYLTPIANVPDDDEHMIYSVKNDAGVAILWYNDHQYLTEGGISVAEEYYSDLADEQKIVVSKSSPYYGYKDITFDTGLFNTLYTEWQCAGEEVHVMGNAEQFYIVAFSPDNVSIRDMYISYKDGEVYFYKYHNKYLIKDTQAHDALLQIAEMYCS